MVQFKPLAPLARRSRKLPPKSLRCLRSRAGGPGQAAEAKVEGVRHGVLRFAGLDGWLGSRCRAKDTYEIAFVRAGARHGDVAARFLQETSRNVCFCCLEETNEFLMAGP